jgi:hypothetical protein
MQYPLADQAEAGTSELEVTFALHILTSDSKRYPALRLAPIYSFGKLPIAH